MSLTMTEQILLLTLWRLGDEATGVAIRQQFSDLTGRDVAFGTIYNNMDQLIRKGFARSQKGEASAIRGGRAKVYYRLTPEGAEALESQRALQERLWDGIPAGAFMKDE